MPDTIASWYSDTSLPRQAAGAVSAMYIGETIAAAPTAEATDHPESDEARQGIGEPGAGPGYGEKCRAHHQEITPTEAVRKPAGEKCPGTATDQQRADSPAERISSRWKNGLIYGIAPEITAVSKPNSSPPRAATALTATIKPLGCTGLGGKCEASIKNSAGEDITR